MFLAGLLLLGCGDGEKAAETPAATQPTGAGTPSAEKVPGVTDTEILLGTHMPISQTVAAAYAPVADGIRAYFAYVNSQGGVYGRKITFLVEQDGVFAIISGLGDAGHAAVWKYLEERGVPDMWISGGLVKWTDPVVKSRFQGNPDYHTEGKMLGKYIAENYNGKKVGLLLSHDEFGVDGKAGILKGLEGSDVQIVAEETYESTQWDVTAQTQRLKNANPDLVVAYAIPPPAASLVKVAREVLNWDVPVLVSGVSVSDIFISLAGAQNAEGVVSVVFARQIYDAQDPGVQQHIQIMQQFGQGVPASNFTLYGQVVAELMVKALENAGQNLTPESLEDGAEAIRDWCCSMCVVPVNLSPTDHRPFEMEVYDRVENGKWVAFGEPINFESTLGEVIGCKAGGEPVYAGEGE